MVEFEQLARVIQQGLIDGQENPVAVIHALGLHLSQGYLSMLNYTYGTIVHGQQDEPGESGSGPSAGPARRIPAMPPSLCVF